MWSWPCAFKGAELLQGVRHARCQRADESITLCHVFRIVGELPQVTLLIQQIGRRDRAAARIQQRIPARPTRFPT